MVQGGIHARNDLIESNLHPMQHNYFRSPNGVMSNELFVYLSVRVYALCPVLGRLASACQPLQKIQTILKTTNSR